MVIAGIIRSGYTVFPISPRNSPSAVAHLLRKVSVTHIILGEEKAIVDLYSASLRILDVEPTLRIKTSTMLDFESIFRNLHDASPPNLEVAFDLDCLALIIHSSGTTAFPKLVPYTHYKALQLSCTPCMYF